MIFTSSKETFFLPGTFLVGEALSLGISFGDLPTVGLEEAGWVPFCNLLEGKAFGGIKEGEEAVGT
jgi:hypothetical protein